MHPFLKKIMNYRDVKFILGAIRYRVVFSLGIGSLAALSGTAHCFAGYTSPGSRAFADSNSSGAYLIAGDRKIILRSGKREAAFAVVTNSSTQPSVVTGALLEKSHLPDDPSATHATVCAHKKLYSITLRSNASNELKTVDLAKPLNLGGVRDLRCAVNRSNGDWIAVNIRTGLVYFANGSTLDISEFGQNWTHAVSLENRFLILGNNGAAVHLTPHSVDSYKYSIEPIPAPFTDLENRDTLATQRNAILRTGDKQTSLTYFMSDPDSPHWTEPLQIALSPCAEQGGCGAHLAPDGRWLVAGSWGTFIGRGKNFSRIKAPLLISDATSPGAALIVTLEKYVLVGDIDSDVADLPKEAELTRFFNTENFQKYNLDTQQSEQRHVVWKKPTKNTSTESDSELSERMLFSYKPHNNSEAFSGSVVIFKGPLPDSWPKEWIAAEPPTHFQALALSSEWAPAMSTAALPPVKTGWWSERMGFERAISFLRKKGIALSPVLVAIVDSGLDPQHPALAPVLHHNHAEIPNNGLDDDNNGLVDDDVGYDFVTEQPKLSDPFGHGTHVAGLISNAWAGSGSLGGAPNALIRSFRALDSSGKSNSIDLARAIAAAIESHADIINCSWGGGPETQVLRDAFAAAQRKSVLVFTSAGNDGLKINDAQPVPKNYSGVVPIAAATSQNSRARFSNWGDKVVFGFAPGVEILSTLPESRYGEKSGTSMASPIAASSTAILLGILKNIRPEWSKQQQTERALEVLCKSANKQKLQKGFSKCGSLSTEASVVELISTAHDLR